MNAFKILPGYLRKTFLLLSVFLLLVNIVGIFLHPSIDTEASRQKKGIPGYDHPVSDKKLLLQMLKKKADTSDHAFVETSTGMVFNCLFHSDVRRIGFFENWIMWVCGKFYDPVSRTQDARLLVKGGGGNCSERTQVLMDIFKINGLSSAVIALNGHITLQVYFHGQWIVCDPDYGLVYKGNMQVMTTEAALKYADSSLLVNGFNQEMRNRYLNFWKTDIDNSVSPLDEVSSLRLYKAEKISQWLRWIIPVLILLGCIIPFKKKNKPARAGTDGEY